MEIPSSHELGRDDTESLQRLSRDQLSRCRHFWTSCCFVHVQNREALRKIWPLSVIVNSPKLLTSAIVRLCRLCLVQRWGSITIEAIPKPSPYHCLYTQGLLFSESFAGSAGETQLSKRFSRKQNNTGCILQAMPMFAKLLQSLCYKSQGHLLMAW
jgi:hypothetical protein